MIDQIAQAVVARARKGINHGCVVIPEGLIEFIPDLKGLMAELNDAMAKYASEFAASPPEAKPGFIVGRLSEANAKIFSSLPDEIQRQLLLERDSHGNVQVTQIPTEKLLIDMVTARVKQIDPKVKFATQNHFFGYEGRCGAPSLFDAAYTYNLGLAAGSLVLDGRTGYIVAVTDFDKGGRVLALPLIALMNIERRGGKGRVRHQEGARHGRFARVQVLRFAARRLGGGGPLRLARPAAALGPDREPASDHGGAQPGLLRPGLQYRRLRNDKAKGRRRLCSTRPRPRCWLCRGARARRSARSCASPCPPRPRPSSRWPRCSGDAARPSPAGSLRRNRARPRSSRHGRSPRSP